MNKTTDKHFLTLVNGGKTKNRTITLSWRKTPYNDDFRALQKEVGGTFVKAHVCDELDAMRISAWVDDDGLFKELPPTLPYPDVYGGTSYLVGNVCFLKDGTDGNQYGLNNEEIDAVETIVGRILHENNEMIIKNYEKRQS